MPAQLGLGDLARPLDKTNFTVIKSKISYLILSYTLDHFSQFIQNPIMQQEKQAPFFHPWDDGAGAGIFLFFLPPGELNELTFAEIQLFNAKCYK